jgi:uncharacterized protein
MNQDRSPLDEAKSLLRRTATRIAVVGASNDPAKYGNIIVNDLKSRGYTVLPVNPKEATIAGLPVYRSLADVPKPVDIVDVVTPPPVTRQVLKDAGAAGMPLVWLQDGSFDEAVLEEAKTAPFKTVHHACIMVVARAVAGERA